MSVVKSKHGVFVYNDCLVSYFMDNINKLKETIRALSTVIDRLSISLLRCDTISDEDLLYIQKASSMVLQLEEQGIL